MTPFDFFSKPDNAKVATLLVLSPLKEEEKRGWLELLPFMNSEEKETLSKNLREEIEDFTELEKISIEKLNVKLKELFA